MTSWLIDKSALVRIGSSPDASTWSTRAHRGLISITTPTLLEQGYSARNAAEWHDVLDRAPIAWFPVATLTPQAERRALEVQRMLAQRGQHRAPSVPDLLIAAVAEVGGFTVLHVDKDFELIAEVTGQPIERLQLPGA